MQRQVANTNMVNHVHSTVHKSNTCCITAIVCLCLEASSQSSQCAQELLQVKFTAHSTQALLQVKFTAHSTQALLQVELSTRSTNTYSLYTASGEVHYARFCLFLR